MTRAEIFNQIFWIFLLIGTAVGIIVIAYMLYNAYKYRDRDGQEFEIDDDRPTLGELPSGGGGGRKLFVSLLLSAIIVISLVAWTYTMLIAVEAEPPQTQDQIKIKVEGYRFGWRFIYPNGYESTELRVPKGRTVTLTVTSIDVFHNFAIPDLRVKTDAIPGQTTDVWFIAPKTGTYLAQCFELCGAAHSQMEAKVIVMPPEKFDKWYASTGGNGTSASNTTAEVMT